jgi:hypothetical protein
MAFINKTVTTAKVTGTDSRYVLILRTKHKTVTAHMLGSLVGQVPVLCHLCNVHRRIEQCAPRYRRNDASGDLGHVVCPLSSVRYAISIFSLRLAHSAAPLRTVSPALYSGLTWRNRKTEMWHFRHYNQRPRSAPTIHLSHIPGSNFQTLKVKNALGPKHPCLDVYKYSYRTVH